MRQKSTRIETDYDQLILKFGGRIRAARKALRMNLKQVSALADVTESFLSKLENNRVQPSLATLHRIASVLRTNISVLLSADDSEKDVVTITRNDSRSIRTFAGSKKGKKIRLELLIPGDQQIPLQAGIHLIDAGASSSERYSHTGSEFGYVLR